MILITGASGNNGTEIVRLLSQQGVRVRAMTRKQHDSRPHSHRQRRVQGGPA